MKVKDKDKDKEKNKDYEVLGTLNTLTEIDVIKEKLIASYNALRKIGEKPNFETLGKYDKEKVNFASLVFDFASVRFEYLEKKSECVKFVTTRTVEIMEYSLSFAEKICTKKFEVDESKGDLFAKLYSDLEKYVICPETAQEQSDELGGVTFAKKIGYLKTKKEEENKKVNCKPDEQVHKDLKRLEKYLDLLEQMGKGMNSTETGYTPETILWLSSQMNISEKKVEELIVFSQISKENIVYKNSEGEEFLKTDTDGFIEKNETERRKQSENNLSPFFEKFEKAYIGLQERTKKYISSLFTQYLLDEFSKQDKKTGNISFNLIASEMENYTFADKDMLHKCIKDSYIPARKDVAAVFGKDITDASRTLKNFLKRI